MKTILVGIALLAVLGCAAEAASRDDLWKKVDEAVSQGLPRTAITNLNLIIPTAVADQAWGEAAKAIGRKIVMEANIEGNKAEEKITRMQDEIAKAPPQIVPLLRAVEANWWWQYFQNNRWRFLQRTATAQAPGADFTTWDLPRLFAEIDKVYGQALSAADTLKTIPVSQFDDLLVKGTVPDSYRPTLYDFVANQALKFYTSGEQAGAKAEDEFELSVDGPRRAGLASPFATADEFTANENKEILLGTGGMELLLKMRASPVGKAYLLFHDLIFFHQQRVQQQVEDVSALLDVDLARLAWAYNVAYGEDKAARYKAALKAFVDKWADDDLSALALHQWASVLQSEGDLVEARRLALRGEGAHRQSPGGLMCHNLVQSIEAKSAAITTERVWNQPWPKIAVRYRNVTNIYFRAVAWDWNEFLDKRHARPEYLNQTDRDALLALKPVLEWSASLPATPDFKERTIALPSPGTLKAGFYFIIASHDPKFGDADNQVTFSDVWVSDLALVVVTRDGDVGGFVLNANSGEPIVSAEVVAWYLDNNGIRRTNGTPQRTDANGRFAFTPTQNRPLLLRARANGQELGTMQEYSSWKPGRPQPNDQVIFFSDRALYRPGQTISYKGIAVHVDQERNNYDVLKGRDLEVAFLDPNGKEVAKATQRANDFGSIHGSFTAPRDRVMGQYQITVRSGANGATWFNVEEYKRPKFQVTLEAPKTAPKLNDAVSVTGKAEAYTGAAVDGALVKWRVVRDVRWPDWWGWWGWGWRGGIARGNASHEIAHGTSRTDANGAFQVEFNAKPDPAVDEKSEASFTFRIYADVTDTAGETRSADRGVNVGFVALRANISTIDWQTATNAVALNLLTTTLDGEPQKAEGALKIVRLKEPAQVQRARLPGMPWPARSDTEEGMDLQDMANPNNWPEGETAFEKGWTSDAEGKAAFSANLGVGVYRVLVETQDRFGKKVTARTQFTVLDPGADKLAIKIPNLVKAPQWQADAGAEFMALWGTGYEVGRAFVEVEHRGKFLQSFWTKPGVTQVQIRQAVSEAMRGGFTVHVTQVRENRAYLHSQHVDVPWSNKELELNWEHFVSKLQPGQQETWSLVVKGGKAERRAAEMVATLYDESLDQYRRLDWLQRFGFFYHDYSQRSSDFANLARQFNHLRGNWNTDYRSVERRYREFPADLVANFWGFMWAGRGNRMFGMRARGGMGGDMMEMTAMPAPAAAPMMADGIAPVDPMTGSAVLSAEGEPGVRGDARKKQTRVTTLPGQAEAKDDGKGLDLSQVTARKNLNETAFFFPQLTTDTNGVVRMTFTMPEALTQWRFLGFAYDSKLRSGALDAHAVTAKDIMVQPNPPRFLREGDVLEFTVKVSNQSAARQTGKVQLTFRNAATEASADALLGNKTLAQDFDIPAKESRSFSWRIKVPDSAPFLAYKAVASTGRLSDGEEGYLPVLSRRIFVTESLPLPVRVKSGQGAVTKKFEFTKLLQSGQSDTLVSENLVVQMVSNPSWYAVLALPYLMEYPYECNEQTFNRLYANALARHIANSDPKIRRIFDLWKNTPALDSPLEKNQDLKSVMLEETPWVRQAQNESQARKNVGLLFDDNRLNAELASALNKLREAQLGDGSWPWFPGGRGDDYITLYITAGFGRLRQLGVEQIDVAPAIRALARLDNWMHEHYLRIQQLPHPEEYVLSPTDAFFLYGRSFFLKDRAVAKNHEEAIRFFLNQGRKLWLRTADRQSQGQLAIAIKRFNAVPTFSVPNDPTPMAILRSLKERSVTSEELGMFWRDLELSWWWYRAPIETQALMIEAFDEVAGDRDSVEECRVWLLKQKQTQDWKTTKATADAVYALLLRGKDILASDKLVEVMIDGVNVTPSPSPRPSPPAGERVPEGRARGREEQAAAIEPGTGFYEVRFTGKDIKPKMGEITVKKTDEGVAWGSVHWQYLEDMSKVTPYEGTPLKLKKALFTKVNTARGPELQAVKGALAVGDELVVRIELRVDRDMEYIHLKDQRGSGTEPVNVLSRYKYQDGLGYYETTRDTASHFFISYLPKGTYVFEYSTRVQHRGEYQTGMASIQCMYAPEFNSHSESFKLTVK